jgi:chemotaxis protein histidine kinase CheA
VVRPIGKVMAQEQIHVNPDYEAVWRSLASALFREQTGLLLGYGFPGRVDETNVDAAVQQHPTPEHLVQMILARRLARSETAQHLLQQLARWYGAMAVHIYGSTARHYRLQRKRVTELVGQANEMLAGEAPEPDADDTAEAQLLYDTGARELGRHLTRVCDGNLAVSVRDLAALDVKVVRRPRLAERDLTALQLLPPALDDSVGRSHRVHVQLPQKETALAADTRGLLLLRALDDQGATFAALWSPPPDRRAWWEAPLAVTVLHAAVAEAQGMTRGSFAKALSVVAVALPVPKDAIEAAWLVGQHQEETAEAGAAAAEEQGPEQASAAEEQGPEQASAAEEQGPEQASAAEEQGPEEASAAEGQGPETAASAEGQGPEEAAVAEEQGPEEAAAAEGQEFAAAGAAAVEPDEAFAAKDAAAATPSDTFAGASQTLVPQEPLGGQSSRRAKVSALSWVTVLPAAGTTALRKLRRLVVRAGQQQQQQQRRQQQQQHGPVMFDLLDLSPELLLCLVLAPNSAVRSDAWALLAEISQDAEDTADAQSVRVALGLVRDEGVSDEEILADAGRSGIVHAEGPMLRLVLPATSRAAQLLPQAGEVLFEFAARHWLYRVLHASGDPPICYSRRRAGYRARAVAEEEEAALRRLLNEGAAEAAGAAAGAEALPDVQRWAGTGVELTKDSIPRGAAPHGDGLGKHAFQMGIALRGAPGWRELAHSQGRRFEKALENVLNGAYDASEEVSSLLLRPDERPV